ncbi:MAG: hypothetical protein AD742_05755 [Methylibium sp. NZG]|nr:MAG: hypothetical protein AD742_05755 [Methylibium sp. NZG]
MVELLGRDGSVRQSFAVHGWPLRIGRALDNDVVLSDAHVAPVHLTIAPQAAPAAPAVSDLVLHDVPQRAHGTVDVARTDAAAHLTLTVGETVNGVLLGTRRWRTGERAVLPVTGPAPEFTLGRTRLRLRLAGQPLPPELPVAAAALDDARLGSIALAAVVLLAALLFQTYLDADPDLLGRAVAATLLTAVVGTMVWCGLWALLSKMFTHQTRFAWHLRVFLWAWIAWLAADVAPRLLAFVVSWPAPSSFAFVGTLGVAAVAFYFHLLAVEPARPKLLRGVALVGWCVGVGVMLWFNIQRGDRLGEELYMNHLFPPALRLAKPVASDTFIERLQSLQPVLDKKAKEAASGGESNAGAGDEE